MSTPKAPHRWRMRVTLPSEVANAWLIPILSPLFRMGETYGVPLIITMDMGTFGQFMDLVAQTDPGQKVGTLCIERVDLNKEPRRVMFNHGTTYDEERFN